MKKILLVLSALILAIACAAPPTNRDAVSTNRNENAATPTAPAMTEADAIAKEKAIWEAIKQKDYDAFANMLAEDSSEVMPEGVMDKAGSVAGIKQFEPTEANFSDWKFLSIDKDAFIVSYTVQVKGKFDGKDFPPESAHASSAWVNRNNKWVAIYHQECPVAKAPPPPPPAKAATAKASPTPATPATTTTLGPDAIANEKMVWDLFKSKNYDAFAELLAPEFIEVEPDGVYDKAGSVKGVTMFDASKAVLEDFKTVKIGTDAALVTYIAKNAGPNPMGDRHSTIWVSRNGKWMGLFHHGGTPVRKPLPTPAPKASAAPSVK